MFEVGFSELLVLFALALVVLGPERLPKLASQIGRWVGRARAMARQFREQLEAEASSIEAAASSPPPNPPPPTPPPSNAPEPSSPNVTPSEETRTEPERQHERGV